MSVAELKHYILKSKYARYNQEARRREAYDEAVNRVRGMMHVRYPMPEVTRIIDWAYDGVLREVALGSQRAMQYGGEPIFRKNARMYNCCASYADRLRFFQEAFWLLLCGCGTGFSVQKHHVSHLPDFAGREVERIRNPFAMVDRIDSVTYTVPDTIEGWADSLGVLLSAYFPGGPHPEYFGKYVEFDFSLIRPKGSPLSSGAGRAPGPDPLGIALGRVRTLIDTCILRGQSRLRPIDVYDIVMLVSDAVLAGGVRRSASICIFSPDDEEMAMSKTGDWLRENPQRARSNNSAMLLRHHTTYDQFASLVEHARQFGEPGFAWADNNEFIPNPCFHPDTLLSTEAGLVRVADLAMDGRPVCVLSDDRVGRGDALYPEKIGVSLHAATPVVQTQRDAPIFEVETEHGHILKVTETHEFPTTRGRLRLRDMVVGDAILLPSGEGCFGGVGTFEDGFVIGSVAGDGHISDGMAFISVWEDDFDSLDDIGRIFNGASSDVPTVGRSLRRSSPFGWVSATATKNKMKRVLGGRRVYRHMMERLGIEDPASIKDRVPTCVFEGSREMARGYLQGLFFADGTCNFSGHHQPPTFSLRIGQSNVQLLRDVQVLLSQFGIVSRIYHRREAGWRPMPDGNGGVKDYYCKDAYEIILNRPNAIRFIDEIGIFGRKAAIADDMVERCGRACYKPERYRTRVRRITPCGNSDVYCLTQDDTNAVVAQGVVTGQCFEIGFWAKLRLDHPETEDILRDYHGPIGYDSPDMVPNASGFSFCNLSTINGSKVHTPNDFYHGCAVAAVLGTLQAGFTEFPYLGRVSEEIARRESLLGVSITSLMSNPKVMLDPEVLRRGAGIVLATNQSVARLIGINPCARGTCIKPEGTSTLMLGSLASGCHGWPFARGIRHVQANRDEVVYRWFRAFNPEACQPSRWARDGTDDVIAFPVEAPPGARLQGDMTAVEFLDVVKTLYLNWVVPGKRPERCSQPWLHHSVSNTVKVKDHEWEAVTRHIYANRWCYAGVSLLSWTGDKDYEQAPNVAVYTRDELAAMYGEVAVSLVPCTYQRVLDAYGGDLWQACRDLESGVIPGDPERAMAYGVADWFCVNHMRGDRRQMCYLFKDLYYADAYDSLRHTFSPVPYEHLIEEDDATTPLAEPSCVGGACSLA